MVGKEKENVPDIQEDMGSADSQRRTELDLLSLAIRFPELVSIIQDRLNPEHVSDSEAGKIIKDFIIERGVAPIETAVQDIFSDLSYTINKKIDKKDIIRVIDNIGVAFKTEYARRSLPLKIAKSKSLQDTREILIKSFAILSEENIDEKTSNVEEYRSEFWTEYGQDNGMLKCGIEPIDSSLDGGFQYTDLVVISAETGLGKTAFVLQILDNFSKSQKTKVALFEMEMKRSKLLTRLAGADCENVTCTDIINKRMNKEQEKEVDDFLKNFAKRKNSFFIVDDVFDYGAIKTKMRKLAAMGVKVFAIDYLQLMMEDPSSVKLVEIITRGLKQLAMKLNIMVILIVQFKYKDDTKMIQDKVVKREPELQDMKGGSALSQNADRVFFLWHDPKLCENEMVNEYHIEFLAKKERSGTAFRKYIKFIRNKQKFTSCEPGFLPPWKQNEPPKFKKG